MDRVILEINGLSKQFDTVNPSGVRNIDLTIDKGEIVAIVGESGSGKSTLLKLIYGLLAPDAGTINFWGEHVKGPHEQLIPGHKQMKMVTQDFALNIYAKVYDNIASMLSNTDVEAKQEQTLQMMEYLNIDHLKDKRVAELSGGEQQRVAIARAIITEPEVLLLDEPFSQVDTILKQQLRDDLLRLARYLGITIILVSHDPLDGLSLADKLVLIKDGDILQYGSPKEVGTNPSCAYVGMLLGGANVMPASVGRMFDGISMEEEELLLVYPYQLVPVIEGGVETTVKAVTFKLAHDELTVELDGQNFKLVTSVGHYKEGDIMEIDIIGSTRVSH